MYSFNFENDVSDLIFGGELFHFFTPKDIKLWVPNLTMFLISYLMASCSIFSHLRTFGYQTLGTKSTGSDTFNHEDNKVKRYKPKRCYLLKGVIKNYYAMINRKTFYEQPIDSDTKQYEEIRKEGRG